MELSRAINSYLSARYGLISEKTTRIYGQSLRLLLAFLGDFEIEQIALDDLRAFRASLFDHQPRLSIWTIHGHIRVTRQLFKWLAEEGKIRRNTAARLELPELGNEPPKGITAEDLQRMFQAAASSTRDTAILLFLADTGSRVGGVSHLRLEDLELARGRATVHEKGRKGRVKSRVVYLGERTVQALEAWLVERKTFIGRRAKRHLWLDEGWVFVGHRRGRLTEGGIHEALKVIAERAGVLGRSNPHAFRHGLARALLERGLDLARVAQILGHSSVEVTARFYGRFADEELRTAHDRYSWVGKPGEQAK